MFILQHRRVLLGAASLPFLGGVTRAQSAWPDRPVRFMVAFAPSGPADIIARFVAQSLAEVWPQPVVVENRGGAGGNVAAQQVARTRPDGTLALVTTSAFAVNPTLSRHAGYTPADFAVASVIAATPNVFVVRSDSPAKDLAGLIELGRRNKTLTFATAGVGTTPHLSAENLLGSMAKLDVQHIPFTGAGPALTAVIGGQVDMASVALPAAMEMARQGAVRGVAVTSAGRAPGLPEVPSAAESGFLDVDDVTWVGLFFPTGTPGTVLTRANADIDKVLATSALRDRLSGTGFAPIGGGLDQAANFVAAEVVRWGDVVRRLSIQVD